MSITIRPAREADVAEMSRVLIASITELCAADHGGQAERLEAWTANKTPAGVARMLAQDGNTMFVAERDGVLAAVGLVHGDTIGLNYVDPEQRFAGISKTLLAAMEAALRDAGIVVGKLTSTATARVFYLGRGWLETGPAAPGSGYPMEKRL